MRWRTELNLGGKPRLVGATVYVLATLLAIALTWSYFTEVDVVVRAPGLVRPDGEVVRITSEVAGTIEAVHVEEGDAVHTGDIVVRLDNQQIRLERETIEHQIALAGEQLRDLDRRIATTARIHVLELEKLDTEIRSARQVLEQGHREHAAQMESASLRLEQTRQEHLRNQQLFAEGLISRQTSDRFRNDFNLAEAQHLEILYRKPTDASLQSLLETKNLIDAELESLQQDLRMESVPIEAQRTELRSRQQQVDQEAERRFIRSPSTGQITLLPTVHPGEHIAAGTLIATLAPTPVRPIVEAWVPNAKATDLRPGQPARLRLDDSETIDGIVFAVSPDVRFTESANGAFQVLIAPDTLGLRLGLAVDVRLITRQERVLTLLFNRIERAFD